jgi:hypothetical protein
MQKYPFEVSFPEIKSNPEPYISAIFACLESEFLVLPKGVGFVEYPVFERGYEALKLATGGFTDLSAKRVFPTTLSVAISIVVLRTILGLTPPE